MYCADIDCNPVKEITDMPYASTKTMKKEDDSKGPVIHDCGYDAHVTRMLRITKIMISQKKLHNRLKNRCPAPGPWPKIKCLKKGCLFLV